jgi:hypothetical protein
LQAWTNPKTANEQAKIDKNENNEVAPKRGMEATSL